MPRVLLSSSESAEREQRERECKERCAGVRKREGKWCEVTASLSRQLRENSHARVRMCHAQVPTTRDARCDFARDYSHVGVQVSL